MKYLLNTSEKIILQAFKPINGGKAFRQINNYSLKPNTVPGYLGTGQSLIGDNTYCIAIL